MKQDDVRERLLNTKVFDHANDDQGNTHKENLAMADEVIRVISTSLLQKMEGLRNKYLEDPYKCDGDCCDAHESSEQALSDCIAIVKENI